MKLFEQCMAIVFLNEGGYVSAEWAAAIGDGGGETNFGITEVTLRRLGLEKLGLLGIESLDPSDLTQGQAQAIYLEHYWKPVSYYSGIDWGLTLAMFDAEVQHGRGVKLLQKTVGTKQDGILGQKTRTAVANMNSTLLLLKYQGIREELVVRWALADSRRHPLIWGLIKRVDSIRIAATQLRWQQAES